jgi:D-alanyl-lipoteichoic acid acyltransferase DltB (MBOAT superfamily)
MLFNSISFAIFFPLVFFIYWFIGRFGLKTQNTFLIGASYFFYACWDYRFLFLLIFSTFLDYYTGSKIFDAKTTRAKKKWLWLSIIVNLGFLGVFKYFNFFSESFSEMFTAFGFQADPVLLHIILPVGISFYTFHGLSYVIDLYYGRIVPERNFINYALFVSFFPLLVAGPIERATHLLPQVQKPRTFEYNKAIDGLRQILWGLFKKIVVADTCAIYVNAVFDNPHLYSGSSHAVAAIFFAFQIYGDFSGYSDIALGTARLLGFELLRNFNFPYFSRDIAEFWRRWHISLSSWFRDYLYIPLGGSRGSTLKKVRNIFIIFVVSGFWHGANWTFLAWGALNALYFLPLMMLNKNRENIGTVAQGRILPSPRELWQMVVTFALTVFAWIFFRAETMTDAFHFIGRIFNRDLFSMPQNLPPKSIQLLLAFIVIEWLGRERNFAIANIRAKIPQPLRWSFYLVIVIMIITTTRTAQQFIYFQF